MNLRKYIRLTLATLLCGVGLFGCNLPSLPPDFTEEPPREDAGLPDVDDPVVCEPSSRECLANSVRVCSADGTDFDIRACGASATCTDGRCLPLENTCDKGQPFALSTTELVYEITEDNKSQTQIVTIDNCGVEPIFVEQVDVRGPSRPDMQPVFRLSTDTPTRITLEPGESLDIRVIYAPALDFTQVTGSLDLGIITSEYTRYAIGLRTRSRCVTTTPFIDWSPTSDTSETRVAWIQNCGTEPVEISGIESQDFSLEPLEKVPAMLAPGRHIGVEILLPDETGPFEGRVFFVVDGAEEGLTEVRGVRLAGDCIEGADEPGVRVAVNNVPRELEDGFVEVAPTDTVRLLADGLPPELRADYWQVFAPPEFTSSLQRLRGETIVSPIVSGNYAYELVAHDEDYRPLCDRPTVEIESWPNRGVWAELTWVNVSDLVGADSGFANGVDLNLHVKPRDADWLGSQDCSANRDENCSIGRLVASSVSGASPEIVSYQGYVNELEFGIYLANPFNFGGAQATLRIWQGRQLIDLRSAFVSEAGNFWLVGRLDPATRNFTEIDSISDGFPR